MLLKNSLQGVSMTLHSANLIVSDKSEIMAHSMALWKAISNARLQQTNQYDGL